MVVHAWQPASMARQSWPQANATLLMAFMMPLLCVVARYGSSTANVCASKMPWMTASPSSLSAFDAISSGVNTASTRARRCAARLERILKCARPSVKASNLGATRSAIVFTALAPIASLQSTRRCTTSIVPRFVETTRVSMALQPPPSAIIREGTSLQNAINSSPASLMER